MIRPIIHTIIGYILASALFLGWVAFGMALATSPVYSTIKGWHERSDLRNTLRIVGAALGLIVGLDIVLGALNAGITFPH
jgi:hypothetical protein